MLKRTALHTVTSFIPAKDAPKQSPVDMAPQPEYKSSKVHSEEPELLFWVVFPLARLALLTQPLDPDSLEIVEDASLSVLTVSGLSEENTSNGKTQQSTVQKNKRDHLLVI